MAGRGCASAPNKQGTMAQQTRRATHLCLFWDVGDHAGASAALALMAGKRPGTRLVTWLRPPSQSTHGRTRVAGTQQSLGATSATPMPSPGMLCGLRPALPRIGMPWRAQHQSTPSGCESESKTRRTPLQCDVNPPAYIHGWCGTTLKHHSTGTARVLEGSTCLSQWPACGTTG